MTVANYKISRPIGLAEVYSLLGVTPTGGIYDAGTICMSPNINKWSLYKPIVVNKPQALTEQDFYDYNFGYTIPSYNSYTAMTRGVSNGWTYGRPTASDWKRLTDFEGYDHRATAPFALTLESGSPRLDGTCATSTPREIYWLTNWAAWRGYQGASAQYLNCGVYVPGVGYYPFTDTDQGQTIQELDNSKLNFDTPSSKFSTGKTYQVYLILTTWDGQNGARQWYTPGETEGGTWWVLATDSPLSFQCLPALTPLQYLTLNISNGRTTIDQSAGYSVFTNTSFTAKVSMSSEYTGNVNVSATFYVDNVVNGSTTRTVTIGSMSATGLTGGGSSSKNISYASRLEMLAMTERLTVRAYITVTAGTQQYNQTQNFSIDPTTWLG